CAWPVAVPDRWAENNPVLGATWLPTTSTFNTVGFVPGVGGPDAYTPPSVTRSGTGIKGTGFSLLPNLLNADNQPLTIQLPALPGMGVNAGEFVPVSVGGGFGGALTSCSGTPVTIGQTLTRDAAGAMTTATTAALARMA